MKDFLRKASSFCLGFVDFTRDKVESLVEEMVHRGEITQQESPEAVKQLLERAQEAQAALVDKVKELVARALAEAKPWAADMRGLADKLKEDMEALAKRLAVLEKEIKKRKGA